MIYEMPMPSLGADMDEAKMVEWKIKPGDVVKKNQVIASVETTKSMIDIESYHEGKIAELLAQIGDIIQVGHPILKMETIETIIAAPQKVRMKISPVAKKLAEENYINVSLIKGSGKEGEITLKDVQSLIESKAEKPHTGINLRDAIAALMAKSKKEIPHYYLHRQIQLNTFMRWLDEKNKTLSIDDRILIPSAIMRAVVISLKKFPLLNGHYKNNKFEASSQIHLGIAISSKENGVMAPAILEADSTPLLEFNKAILSLAERTRKGGLKNREISDGTITVTNVGDLGSDEVFGIIFHPQVALIGLGRIRKVPVVNNENEIVSNFVIDVTLSADHRVSDGLYGARLLNEINKVLNDPNKLEEV